MNFFGTFFKKEWRDFQELSQLGQRLLLTFFFFTVAYPMISTFTNTYLWRQSHDLRFMVIYNIAFCLAIPFGFFVNGLMLKKIEPPKLFLAGCLLLGLVPLALIFTKTDQIVTIFLLGLLFGFATGLFWANRNFLTLKLTQSKDRIYFSSLETVLMTVSSIIIPILIGWFLVFGESVRWYGVHQAYEMMALLALGLLLVVGILPRRIRIESSHLQRVHLRHARLLWKTLRQLEFTHGIEHGLSGVLPILLVLTFVGTEGSLGTLQSLSAIISAIITYILGKRADAKHRIKILAAWIIGLIIAASVFSFAFSVLGVIAYFTIISLTDAFRWLSLTPFMFDLIDMEQRATGEHHYSFIFDREIYLAIGRVGALIIFYYFSLWQFTLTLRYALLVVAFVQIGVYVTARRIHRSIHVTTDAPLVKTALIEA